MAKSTEIMPFTHNDLFRWKTDSSGQSVLMYVLANREYPVKSVPNCKTCSLGVWRVYVEREILLGTGYRVIHDSLPDDIRERVSYDSIRNHSNRDHMPFDEIYKRLILEDTAEMLGLDPSDPSALLSNHIAYARMGIEMTMRKMIQGKIDPTISETNQMATVMQRHVERIQDSDASVTRNLLMDMMAIVWDATEKETDPEVLERITHRFAMNPKAQIILKRYQQLTAGTEDAV